MNKKTRKVFTWCLVVAMLVTQMLFANVAFAATSYAGTDRYQTALKVVQAGWTTSENAVIAQGENLADALAAAPLAYAKGKAPILLTDPNSPNNLPTGVMDELTALGVKNVYIVGGTGVVSTAVEDLLKAKFTVKRLGGLDRAATSLLVAQEAFPTAPAKAVIVNGYSYADALSVSSVAAYLGMPILLVDKDTMSTAITTYLTGKTVYAVGGTGVLSDVNIGTATRLSGADRYATNVAVLGAFPLDYSKVFVAIGEDANNVDALGGAALAAKGNNPMVLVNGALSADTATLLTGKVTSDTKVYTLGGVVPASVATAIESIVNSIEFKVKDVTAVNATQLLVTFTQAVEEASAETITNYTVAGVNPIVNGAVLQADGKSVLLTMGAKMTGTVLYVVQPIKLATDTTKTTALFTKAATYDDTVAPTVTGVTYPTYDTVKISFSEPMKALGNITITQDGAAANVTQTTPFAAGATSVTYTLAAGTVAADKPVTFVMVGAVDQADNIISPNPTTLTFTKSKTDTTAPTVVSVTALSNVRLSITFSEKLNAAPTVNVGGAGNPVVFDASDDGITWTGTFTNTTGVATVNVTAFADMSANAGTATSKLLQFTADTTAPTLVSTAVKVFNNKAYAVFTFSEDVVPTVTAPATVNVSGSYVASYITKTLAATAVTPIAYTIVNGADVDNTKAVMVDISNDTKFPVGAYTLTLPNAFVNDKASPVNALVATTATFTKGTSVADLGAPTVNATPTFAADNSYMDVVFSEAMDPATALNVANYTVGGASIFTSAAFINDALHVRLTVNPGTIAYTGLYNVAISGAKDAAGNLMTAYSNSTITVEENVKPYVASAKLTNATTITVTYSENVAAVAAADFEVYIAGVKVDPAKAVTTISAVSTGTATITLTDAITDLSKVIQVKLVNTATADTVGNTAKTGDLVTVTY